MEHTTDPGQDPTITGEPGMAAPDGAVDGASAAPPAAAAESGAAPNTPPDGPAPSAPGPPPGYPGDPGYAGAPQPAPYAPYPGYPPGYPPAPGVTGMAPPPGYVPAPFPPMIPPPTPPRERGPWHPLSWLKGPLPTLLVVLIGVGSVVALVIGAVAGIGGHGGDWAAGAVAAGIVALALAALYLVATGVRVGFGRRARATLLLGGSGIVVLAALGGVGLTALPAPLHRAQAQAFERAHRWPDAISQYQRAGERAPGSHDLARVYDEWGDDLEAHQLYVEASQRYETVIQTYPGATAEAQRARDSDARVLYEIGASLVKAESYQEALRYLDEVASLYPTSSYAAKAHATSATALYAIGQQARTVGNCSGALPTYQTLVQQYGDTPEGAKAKQEMAAPVRVSGQISGAPAIATGTIGLSRRVTGAIAQGESSNFDQSNLSRDYHVAPDASGHYSFPAVAQGKYNLSLAYPDGRLNYWYTLQPYDPYTIIVGPLCSVDAGTYQY